METEKICVRKKNISLDLCLLVAILMHSSKMMAVFTGSFIGFSPRSTQVITVNNRKCFVHSSDTPPMDCLLALSLALLSFFSGRRGRFRDAKPPPKLSPGSLGFIFYFTFLKTPVSRLLTPLLGSKFTCHTLWKKK